MNHWAGHNEAHDLLLHAWPCSRFYVNEISGENRKSFTAARSEFLHLLKIQETRAGRDYRINGGGGGGGSLRTGLAC